MRARRKRTGPGADSGCAVGGEMRRGWNPRPTVRGDARAVLATTEGTETRSAGHGRHWESGSSTLRMTCMSQIGGLGKSRGGRGEAAQQESAPDRAKNAAAMGGRAQTPAAPWAAKWMFGRFGGTIGDFAAAGECGNRRAGGGINGGKARIALGNRRLKNRPAMTPQPKPRNTAPAKRTRRRKRDPWPPSPARGSRATPNPPPSPAPC